MATAPEPRFGNRVVVEIPTDGDWHTTPYVVQVTMDAELRPIQRSDSTPPEVKPPGSPTTTSS